MIGSMTQRNVRTTRKRASVNFSHLSHLNVQRLAELVQVIK